MAFNAQQALVARLVAPESGFELLSIIDEYLNN